MINYFCRNFRVVPDTDLFYSLTGYPVIWPDIRQMKPDTEYKKSPDIRYNPKKLAF